MAGVSFRDADFMVFAERCTKYKKRQSQDSDSLVEDEIELDRD